MSFTIKCPNCGDRSVYEFRFGSEVKPRPNADASDEEWQRYSYADRNEAGIQKEWWYHRLGCQQWFVARRNTVTNEVLSSFFPE